MLLLLMLLLFFLLVVASVLLFLLLLMLLLGRRWTVVLRRLALDHALVHAHQVGYDRGRNYCGPRRHIGRRRRFRLHGSTRGQTGVGG